MTILSESPMLYLAVVHAWTGIILLSGSIPGDRYMALFLNEQEGAQLLPMSECIDVIDQAFAHAGGGKVDNRPRNRIRMHGGFSHFMAASNAGQGVSGYKAYPSCSGPG